MKRVASIFLWSSGFFAAPMALAMGWLLLQWNTPDPPTEIMFAAFICFSPLSAITGFILSFLEKLPGTKKN
jgi:hypothetical protein